MIRRSFFGHATRLLAAWLSALLLPLVAGAAGKNEVKFKSFDHVQLCGTFYATDAGARSPCVILVHRLGGSRQDEGWDELAQTLQKADFAVLSFDLRGHGESTSIDPNTFWRVQANLTYVRGASPKKDRIAFKDFRPDYYPWLANDLAAAKQYLDEQNNARLCNSSSVIVIGAQDGAAVGALWMSSEWLRRRTERDVLGRALPVGPLEGQDVSAAVWLSIPEYLGRGSLANWFRAPLPGTRATLAEKVPMDFLYGKDDRRAASAASMLMKACRGSRAHPTLSASLAKPGKVSGAELLTKEAHTDEDVLTFLKTVLEKRSSTPGGQRTLGTLTPVPLAQFGYYNLR